MSIEFEEEIPFEMSKFVSELVGCKIVEIKVRNYSVDFVFDVCLKKYTLRVTKEFVFSLAKNQPFKYIADSENHDFMLESGNFVFLRNKCCSYVDFSLKGLNLSFDEGFTLFVKFESEDFEPIHFIGTSGVNDEKLEFYYVL